ncbi:MAG: glycosyl transferase [Omnitrophica bacterium RIFCSPHIGHO2_02_FULL_46_11]|nr:MAG: glycosyl transferase [Omnitrophica bacterium RIFCSPLOWO2_01_FULL_45_10b]OGW86554.1 MAG: glycosyl transferase [Omnitrophica bacterium RIFCSPHIGHO2_02_FULL_46_11]
MFPQKVNILGVGVSAINMKTTLDIVDKWIKAKTPHYVCITNVHVVMESQRDEQLRRILNTAGLVTPDGMPLVWVSHFNGLKNTRRVYGPDLMLALCEHSQTKGYKHFFYGGADGVPTKLEDNLKRRFPSLIVAGVYSPPFRPLTEHEDRQIIEMINQSKADIVWVGIGAPKQERWMAEHVGQLKASVLIGVGAAFDFHAGLKKQAPRWIQKSGLEWLFRLASEPRRLWRRYLINNPLFVWLILLQMLGLKRYDLEQNP